MASLADIRAQHPEYNDLSDQQLADGLYKKFYSDLPRQEFDAKMGLAAAPPDAGGMDATLRGIARGATANWADEIAGGLGGAADATLGAIDRATGLELGPAGSKGTFDTGYERTTANARAGDKAADINHPYLSMGGQIAGGLGSLVVGAPGTIAARGLGLGARIVQGAKIGAGYGALAGAGDAEGGLGNRVLGGIEGAATGAVTGGALPIAGKVLRVASKPLTDVVTARFNPAGWGAQKVVDRAAAGGRSVEDMARRLQEAADNGDLMSVGDVGGEQLQRLGRTVINMGGKGGTALKTKLNTEAMAQGGRIATKVNEGIGNPNLDYQEAKAQVMDARSSAARSHYELAYRTQVPFNHQLEEILQTPAGRAGLAAARRNTLNRREPWPNQWLVTGVDEDGTLIASERTVPDTRALDEVKRVLDNMVEGAKRPTDGSPFGKAKATAESIAIQTVRDDLRGFLTRHNPAYRRALDVGLDNIQADEAIEFGRNIFNTDPRVVARRMGMGGAGRDRVFNAGQRELARVGAADAVREAIEGKGFTQNRLLKFFSSTEDLKRLRPLFRSSEDWRSFRTSMFNEARKWQKRQTMMGNSTTTQQLLDAEEAGGLGEAVRTTVHAAHSLPGAIAGLLVRSVRRLGGMTPAVGDQIQRLISTRNPTQVRAIVRQLEAIERSQANQAQKLNAARNLLTAALASQEGRAVAPRPNEQAAQIRAP